MAKKIEAYVDSSAFIAFFDKSDTYHKLFANSFENAGHLITTPLVISETHAWFLRRFDTFVGLKFLNFIEDLKILKIEEVGAKLIEESSQILRLYNDQSLTVVDALGIVIMKKFKLNTCWSTDRHLALAGAKLLIHG